MRGTGSFGLWELWPVGERSGKFGFGLGHRLVGGCYPCRVFTRGIGYYEKIFMRS